MGHYTGDRLFPIVNNCNDRTYFSLLKFHHKVADVMITPGAILVSLLAIIVDGGMALLERIATPEGIKIQRKLSR